jgi:transcriptional regulator with XRE-family HTH domain
MSADVPGRIRRARETKGWSLHQLAVATGLSAEGIRKLEMPDADPKLSTLVAVAKATGAPLGDLLGIDGSSTRVDSTVTRRILALIIEAKHLTDRSALSISPQAVLHKLHLIERLVATGQEAPA